MMHLVHFFNNFLNNYIDIRTFSLNTDVYMCAYIYVYGYTLTLTTFVENTKYINHNVK